MKRFWIWWKDGWVKLSLRDGQELSCHQGGPCEEGYHYESQRFYREGEEVYSEITTYSCDCDGPLDTYTKVRLTDFLPGVPQWDSFDWAIGDVFDISEGIKPSCWERVTASQRDHYAEAMGY